MAQEEREIFLYKITNPKGGIYIGQTVSPRDRFIVYARNDIRNQHKLRNSIQKYGWQNHDCNVITSVPEGQSDYAEKYLIAWYNSTNKKTGLNIMPGGSIKRTPEMIENHRIKMIGRKHSESELKKRSLSLIGNKNAKGSVRSQEFKDNARLKITGIKRPSISKPVLSFTIDGKFVKEYTSCLSTIEDGYSHGSVIKVCKGIYKQHNGMVFKYKNNG